MPTSSTVAITIKTVTLPEPEQFREEVVKAAACIKALERIEEQNAAKMLGEFLDNADDGDATSINNLRRIRLLFERLHRKKLDALSGV